MRWLIMVAVLALGVSSILVPAGQAPLPAPAPGTVTPPLAVCLTDEATTRSSEVDVVSTVAGPGEITLLSGGGTAGSGTFETGASGSVRILVGEIAAVGRSAALVEFPASQSAAATVIRGTTLVSAEVCSQAHDRQVVIGAGSTIMDRIFQVQLMNPYSTAASVDIAAFSEVGRESAEGLQSIIVPARSSVNLDISSILPGRETLNLIVESVRGSVVATATLEAGGDEALWRAVAPGEVWYLPLPVFDGTREVVIASGTGGDVSYQVDLFGPTGVEEAAIEGTIEAGGQTAVDLSQINPAAMAVRVVASGPVAVFARLAREGAVGIGAASPAPSQDWLLPGAGFGTQTAGRLVLVSVGVESASVTVTELRDESRSRLIDLAPGQVLEVDLDDGLTHGIAIASTSEVVPFWIAQRLDAIAVSGGRPHFDQ